MAHHVRARSLLPSLVLVAITGVTGACASILGYDGGQLVGDGGMDAPADGPESQGDGACIPMTCTQNSCATLDSCGHTVPCNCPSITDGCDAGACTSCTWSCGQAKATCGTPNDLCSDDGGLLNCGTCQAGEACNAFTCGSGPCIPLTCADYPDGSCGTFQTGCDGGTLPCNNCPADTKCTGSSCCLLNTCAANYPGQCGQALSDNCGSTLNCSSNCAAGQDCASGTCCTPATACPPGHCGSFTDPCSGTMFPCPPCDGGCIPNPMCPTGLCPSSFDAGCGQTINCTASCGGSEVCDAGTCCTPQTCSGRCGNFTDPCTGFLMSCGCDAGSDAGCSAVDCNGNVTCINGVCQSLPPGCSTMAGGEICMGFGGGVLVGCTCGAGQPPCTQVSSGCVSEAGANQYCCH